MAASFDPGAFENTAFEAGPPVVSLAGSSAGSSTATATLARDIGLAASAAGHTATSAALSVDRALAGASAGSSTATAVLLVPEIVWLAGSSAGSSTAAARLTADTFLAGASIGGSTASAVLTQYVPLAGASAGSSITDGHMSVVNYLHGSSAGSSAASASLSRDIPLYGSSHGQGSASAFMHVSIIVFMHGTSNGSRATTSARLTGGTTEILASVGGLSINAGPYAVAHESLLELESAPVYESVLVEMQARRPVYVRSQLLERQINLTVYLLARDYSQRRLDYAAFANSLDSLSGIVTLQWTDNNGSARQYEVVVLSVSPDAWFNRATAVLIAPDPYAEKVA